MIEFYTVVDVTGGVLTARSKTARYGGGKVHCFDNETAAISRRTLLTNRHQGQKFAVFLTVVRDHGAITSEWVTPVAFQVKAGAYDHMPGA